MSVTAAQVPPHAPEAGWSRRLLGRFHVTGVFWYRIHRAGVRHLPSWAIAFFIAVFTTFFWLCLIKIRRALAANLEAVLGPCGFWTRQVRIYRTMWSFAWCLSERYERLSTERRFELSADGLDHWQVLLDSGRGFIVVSAHLGNWEVGSMQPAAQKWRRVHVVREAETDPRAQEFVSALIKESGGELYVTHFAEDPQLAMVLLDALRAGEIVALQGDRPRSSGAGGSHRTPAMLFGRPFPLPIGPAALARAAEVPMVPIFVVREGRLRYRCVVRPPIEVDRTADRQADVEAAMRRYAADLEAILRAYPHQWFCFRRIWPNEGGSGDFSSA